MELRNFIKETLKIKEYMNIYNSERLHSAIDYQTPDEAYFKGANDKCYNPQKVLLEVA